MAIPVLGLAKASKFFANVTQTARRSRRMQRRAINWHQGLAGMSSRREREDWIDPEEGFGIEEVRRITRLYKKSLRKRVDSMKVRTDDDDDN